MTILPPESPESKGTKKERDLLKRLLEHRKKRRSVKNMSPDEIDDLIEVRNKVGKPHVRQFRQSQN